MDPERAQLLLAQEREQVERAIAALNNEGLGTPPEQDEPGDEGSENVYQNEFDAGLGEELADPLAAGERAASRLAAGTYGLSIESGEPIPDARLEALPTAERTIEEERRG
jgi:DnaK suppressor protein